MKTLVTCHAGVALALVFALNFGVQGTVCAQGETNSSTALIEGFEKDIPGWKFIGGQEFPGAKGSLTIDSAVMHGGQHSAALNADFTGGGAYVGLWRDFDFLEGKEIKELRFWVKSEKIRKIGIRITDHSEQCHQRSGIKLSESSDWQQVTLKIAELVGGEHWGGANDGRWHGPLKGFGLNVGKDSFEKSGSPAGTLYIDDFKVVYGNVLDGQPVIHAAIMDPPQCRPGYGTRLTLQWDAEPMGRDYSVFVHFYGPDGSMAFQRDHAPTTPTSVWKGRVEYTKTIVIPTDAREGDYKILVGLYAPKVAKPLLKIGEGVKAVNADTYEIGVLKVRTNAPVPKLPPASLKIEDYDLTFSEEFNDLSVSPWGPGTRWIAHTPGATDFGDARFADPKDGRPFKIENGILRIEAAKEGDKWQAGLLSSVDSKGKGFSQKFGYFEMRAKFPKGLGTWPAFWLLSVSGLTNKSDTTAEIDVVEQYGVMPNALFTTWHEWIPGGKHNAEGESWVVSGMGDDFHTYGVLVNEKEIVWYYDRAELWRQPTPESAKAPLYILVNLAMGGGWPIDKATSPSYMYVDSVRAYSLKK